MILVSTFTLDSLEVREGKAAAGATASSTNHLVQACALERTMISSSVDTIREAAVTGNDQSVSLA